MYKSQLQILCQKNGWPFPDYTTVKLGPGHDLRFKSTVTVNGLPFETTGVAKQLKEAQNEAARLAYDHFTSPASASASASASGGTSNAVGGIFVVPIRELPNQASQNNVIPRVQQLPTKQETVLTIPNCGVPVTQHLQLPIGPETFQAPRSEEIPAVQQPPIHNDGFPVTQHRQLSIGPETFQAPRSEEIPAVQQPPNRKEPLQHLHNAGDKNMQIFKNQLQIYAQKRRLPLPSYVSEYEGPPHARRFKCKVLIDGKAYDCMEFFNTVKEAEHAAAKIALQSLSPQGLQENNLAFYKNLLQELTQKAGLHLPIYEITGSGSSHNPTFIAHVEVEGQVFQGEVSKTKKLAEMNAAKVAYLSLKDREMGQMPKPHSQHCQSGEALPVNSQSIVTSHSQETTKSEAPTICSIKARARDEDIAVSFPASKGVNGMNETKQDLSSARKRDSSMLDSASVHSKDPSPLSPSLGQCDSSLPWFSAPSSSHVNKVRIFPFTPNMMLPDGVIVCSDEKWVAVKSTADQIGN